MIPFTLIAIIIMIIKKNRIEKHLFGLIIQRLQFNIDLRRIKDWEELV